jgi:hypothetical protein
MRMADHTMWETGNQATDGLVFPSSSMLADLCTVDHNSVDPIW